MRFRLKATFAAISFACLTLTVGCGTSNSADDSDDTTKAELASAPSAIGEGASSTGFARVLDAALSPFNRTDCKDIPFGTCDTATKTETRFFSTDGGDTGPCTRGPSHGRNVFGEAILTFSDASCAFTTAAQTLTRTVANHYIQRGNHGTKVIIYTGTGTVSGKTIADADLKDYSGTTRSGGTVFTLTSGTAGTLSVTGVHRRALHPNGRYGFWHTLYTETPLSVTAISPLTIHSGTLVVAHNRMEKKITETFSDVTYSTGCDHPTGGSITVTDSSDNSSFTVTYGSSCGVATVDGIAGVDLDPLQN